MVHGHLLLLPEGRAANPAPDGKPRHTVLTLAPEVHLPCPRPHHVPIVSHEDSVEPPAAHSIRLSRDVRLEQRFPDVPAPALQRPTRRDQVLGPFSRPLNPYLGNEATVLCRPVRDGLAMHPHEANLVHARRMALPVRGELDAEPHVEL